MPFRIGISGGGFIGCVHGKYLLENKVEGAVLAGVVARSETTRKNVREKLGEKVKLFSSDEEMLNSGLVDGVLIATPHYAHPEQGIHVLNYGKHVLMEKPVGVFTRNVRELNEVAKHSDLKFAMMFNMRIYPIYQKIKSLLQENKIGRLHRILWVITDMFRSRAYYNSDGWRATWKGEGGGALINQGVHHLDLWQWFFGLPESLTAYCNFGKYHQIEVEDDVTTYFQYKDGLTGVLHFSTGEVCGSNRLEIVGDSGKIILEGNTITLQQTKVSATQFHLENTDVWAAPEFETSAFKFENNERSHADITSNWVRAITKGEEMIASGLDGINSLLLSNGMLLSSWKGQALTFPFNEDDFFEKLQEKIATSTR